MTDRSASMKIVRPPRTSGEALERLSKGSFVVQRRRRRARRPVQPITVPGLEQAMREVRAEH